MELFGSHDRREITAGVKPLEDREENIDVGFMVIVYAGSCVGFNS
jgi:hypothetical protein